MQTNTAHGIREAQAAKKRAGLPLWNWARQRGWQIVKAIMLEAEFRLNGTVNVCVALLEASEDHPAAIELHAAGGGVISKASEIRQPVRVSVSAKVRSSGGRLRAAARKASRSSAFRQRRFPAVSKRHISLIFNTIQEKC